MRVFLPHTPDMLANYYGPRALAALREIADVAINDTGGILRGAALAEAAAGCSIIVADRMTPGEAETFANAPDLAAFLRCAVDVSTIDIDAASRHGVLVTRATPGFGVSVAEMGLGYMIDLARGISRSVCDFRSGRVPEGRMGRQLRGSTVGIVGYGEIGQHLAAIAAPLGLRVLVNDPHRSADLPGCENVSFGTLLAEADFVVCLAVSIPQTRNLMDGAAFAQMQPHAFFINLARGELVDEAALLAALEAGEIAGAAMDVGRAADQQPNPALARRADVIATPHMAGLTPSAVEHQAMETVAQVRALSRGQLPERPLNLGAATRLSRLGITPPG
ncbi:NAD(P)-dependent oxidoreductase [Acuticoccus sp. MNP-M23]|uniref:NAD(P)-dependent oxidoreductase n=1 Tax=Acuticoccus sp. MNP-M23 TaxID=3072793 RepID=UPI002815E6FE|nr:NAD(P)-dependent oxidoreductase [Acuticoccus sp. MNP-M23]WMS41434.1 NAD(P)-dependent oxidoreductase [Acuticoccus sp. MNP-M23]